MRLMSDSSPEEILTRYRTEGVPLAGAPIYRRDPPEERIWDIVSRVSRTDDPYRKAVTPIILARAQDPNHPGLPDGLYQIKKSLPPITPDEALAIVYQLLIVQKRAVIAGVQLYAFQWDYLARQYCPFRERHTALRQLITRGYLIESTMSGETSDSSFRWPLTVAEAVLPELRRRRLQARHPFFKRIDDLCSDLLVGFPQVVRALIWILLGGGLLKGIESLSAWISRW